MTNALHLLCAVVLSGMAHARLSQLSRRAIVNGEDADFGRYPYMATLVRFVPNKSRHTCGGSLIAPDIVLTAAHCGNSNISRVQIGHYNRTNDDERFMDDLPIMHQMAHPQYDPENSPPYFDHLLLILDGTSSKPVLRLNSIDEVPMDGDDLTLMGWGYTVPEEKGKGITPDILQQVSTSYVPNNVCKQAAVEYYDTEYNETQVFSYDPWVHHDMMCGLERAEGACSDDSGGPVILKGESPDQDVQVGIVSWSAGIPDSNVTCVSDIFPGVYSRVSTHYKWVAAQVCRFSVDPPAYFNCPPKDE